MQQAQPLLRTLSFREIMHFRGPEAEAMIFKRSGALPSDAAYQQAEATKQQLRNELATLNIPSAHDTGTGISEGYYFMVSMQGDWEMVVNGKSHIDALKAAGMMFEIPQAKSTVKTAQSGLARPLFELSTLSH